MDDAQLSAVLESYPLSDERPWLLAVNVGAIRDRYRTLRETFPAHWRHALAVKAHPLAGTLRRLVQDGAWLEAASLGELELALAVGCPGDHVVFDSPVKTRAEIARALDLGVVLNADNLLELERIADFGPSKGRVGLRVNPELAPGTVEALSVGTRNSKFGVSLSRERDAVLAAFERWAWLDGVHVHVGSFGYSIDLLTAGARAAAELAGEVGAGRIDIGGGMAPGADVVAYRDALSTAVPELFDGRCSVLTEFGRWLFWDHAIAISRVEYVKPAADVTVATIHFGADLLIRHVYQPGQWSYPIEVRRADGAPHEGERGRVTIGGPLCFGGDVLARDAVLPVPAEGDLVVVRDIGAYTFGMWSRYCSRTFPLCVGLDPAPFALSGGQTVAEVVADWG